MVFESIKTEVELQNVPCAKEYMGVCMYLFLLYIYVCVCIHMSQYIYIYTHTYINREDERPNKE